eukprot:363887-Chlamydomonas_euryale.AAC.5
MVRKLGTCPRRTGATPPATSRASSAPHDGKITSGDARGHALQAHMHAFEHAGARACARGAAHEPSILARFPVEGPSDSIFMPPAATLDLGYGAAVARMQAALGWREHRPSAATAAIPSSQIQRSDARSGSV